jgi:catechol 2,3-dioxygenase-like lactoylglutathione lyase family enzyme
MVRVLGVDHISIRVSDFARSKRFYRRLLKFMGFVVEGEYADAAGWHNGKTVFWIGQADTEGKRHPFRIGNVGLHHYAFELSKRADVDELHEFLKKEGATVVDPPGEYYPDYYAVYFLDPDGIKLEGMFYPQAPAKPEPKPRRKAAGKKKGRR